MTLHKCHAVSSLFTPYLAKDQALRFTQASPRKGMHSQSELLGRHRLPLQVILFTVSSTVG